MRGQRSGLVPPSSCRWPLGSNKVIVWVLHALCYPVPSWSFRGHCGVKRLRDARPQNCRDDEDKTNSLTNTAGGWVIWNTSKQIDVNARSHSYTVYFDCHNGSAGGALSARLVHTSAYATHKIRQTFRNVVFMGTLSDPRIRPSCLELFSPSTTSWA